MRRAQLFPIFELASCLTPSFEYLNWSFSFILFLIVILSRYHARVDNITGKRGDDVLLKCHLESSLIDYVSLKAWIRDDGLVISRKHLYHPSSNSTGNQAFFVFITILSQLSPFPLVINIISWNEAARLLMKNKLTWLPRKLCMLMHDERLLQETFQQQKISLIATHSTAVDMVSYFRWNRKEAQFFLTKSVYYI